MAAATTAEKAVRDYLTYLRDPDSMRPDTAEIDAKLEASNDPLERLSLHAQKARMQDPEPSLRAAFITHAKAWAEANDVPAEAFRAEGVRPDVLREAGLDGARRQTRGGRGSGGARRSRVTTEQVRAALPAKGKTFTLRELQSSSGASAATVRKVLGDLISEGYVTDEGPDPDATGPGRAPTLYRVAKKVA